ncbi:MAG TPA: alpha/beta fold hydrolase [Ilumatobacteraceae bacterium]|nr:alpha/beta fold hydrolase [Ilumatobacteraceae bacterium]
MDTKGGTDGDADVERPVVPRGRHLWLEDRGRTFVRELTGPAGAPTVVLLHGWTATADLNWWASYIPLAQHFNVVAIDHRGHGRGIRSADPFRLEQCADDVAALAAALGLEQIIPVGYSMGGPVAQLVWRRHRHLVAGLVLCATSASFQGTPRERMLAGLATGTSALAGAVPLGRLTSAALGKWTGWRSRREAAWWGFEEVGRHDWTQILEAGRETLRFDSRSWIGGIDVPTAVVVTDDDGVVPTARQWALAAQVPGASVWPVHGSHAVCTTSPERFVPSLVAACRRVGEAGAPVPARLAVAA